MWRSGCVALSFSEGICSLSGKADLTDKIMDGFEWFIHFLFGPEPILIQFPVHSISWMLTPAALSDLSFFCAVSGETKTLVVDLLSSSRVLFAIFTPVSASILRGLLPLVSCLNFLPLSLRSPSRVSLCLLARSRPPLYSNVFLCCRISVQPFPSPKPSVGKDLFVFVAPGSDPFFGLYPVPFVVLFTLL